MYSNAFPFQILFHPLNHININKKITVDYYFCELDLMSGLLSSPSVYDKIIQA